MTSKTYISIIVNGHPVYINSIHKPLSDFCVGRVISMRDVSHITCPGTDMELVGFGMAMNSHIPGDDYRIVSIKPSDVKAIPTQIVCEKVVSP